MYVCMYVCVCVCVCVNTHIYIYSLDSGVRGKRRGSDSYFMFGLKDLKEKGGKNSTIILSITLSFSFTSKIGKKLGE